MTKHLRLAVAPTSPSAPASVLKPVHLRCAQHVNRTQGLGGRLWPERFFFRATDEAHTLAAIRDVEHNPVQARLVREASNCR